jgi:hypothetical protein
MEAGSTPSPQRDARSGPPELSGWIAFAGVVLIIVGTLNAFWGLAAIFNDDIVVVGGQGALIFDLTVWGGIHLLLGILGALTGFGLLSGNEAARVTAIFLVALNAVAQIVWFPAAPLWAFLIIILDVTIIYQLTTRWQRA